MRIAVKRLRRDPSRFAVERSDGRDLADAVERDAPVIRDRIGQRPAISGSLLGGVGGGIFGLRARQEVSCVGPRR